MRRGVRHRRRSARQRGLWSSPQGTEDSPAENGGDSSVSSPERWAAERYETAVLPDVRLKQRLVKVIETLARKPTDSINQACEDWACAKGAYRFIENERVTTESLQEPIAEATARDCAGRDLVFAVQDTTTLSFEQARQAEGLGPVNDSSEARGMLFHPTLALSGEGALIGLLDQQLWCRAVVEGPDDEKDPNRPIEQKESFKWIGGIRGARQAIENAVARDQRPRLMHVMDREGDIFDVFESISKAGEGAVIRSSHNRRVITRLGKGGHAHDIVRASALLGTIRTAVPRKHGQKARNAELHICACELTVTPKKSNGSTGRWIDLTLVEVWEPCSPEGIKPLRWLLWTTEPVRCLQQAIRIVEIYKLRWKIEEVFLALKSGCRIEHLQFATADRLAKVVALYAPIAVRIVQLRDRARLRPNEPCISILSEIEWKALWTYIHKKRPRSGAPPPSLKQAMLWIGRLGGHLGRKSDGMPGIRTLWRGYRDLDLLSAMYRFVDT
jgi:hypothetical protein